MELHSWLFSGLSPPLKSQSFTEGCRNGFSFIYSDKGRRSDKLLFSLMVSPEVPLFQPSQRIISQMSEASARHFANSYKSHDHSQSCFTHRGPSYLLCFYTRCCTHTHTCHAITLVCLSVCGSVVLIKEGLTDTYEGHRISGSKQIYICK